MPVIGGRPLQVVGAALRAAVVLGATAAGGTALVDGGFASVGDGALVLVELSALYALPLVALGGAVALGVAALERLGRPRVARALGTAAAVALLAVAIVAAVSFWTNDSDARLALVEPHRHASRLLGAAGALLLVPAVLAAGGRGLRRRLSGAGCLAGALLVVAAGLGGSPAAREPLTPARAPSLSSDPPLLLIGIDGLTASLTGELVEQGRLPHLSALLERSVSGPIETLEPTESASIWTSIATGVVPGTHGVRFFTETRLPGVSAPLQRMPKRLKLRQLLALAERLGLGPRTTPVGSRVRRVPAFWERLSERGYEVAVVGWWAAAPVDPVNGWLVSDRVGFFDWGLGRTASAEIHLEPGTVYPPDLGRRIGSRIVLPGELEGAILEEMSAGGLEAAVWDRAARFQHRDPASELRFSYALDATYRGIALEALAEMPELDCLAVYLRGVDILGHAALWASPLAGEPDVDATDRERYGALYGRYLEWIDGVVGELVAAVGSDATVILVSDHGFQRVKPGRWAHPHAPPGVLAVAGPGIRAGTLADASVLDVMPTLLYLSGLEVPRDLDGRVLAEVRQGAPSAPRRGAARPLEGVPGAADAQDGGGESDVDRAMIEGLEALGYIE